MRRATLSAMLVGVALSGVPPGAAEAQWVLLGRRVLGRVEQMRQSPDGGRPGAEIASVIVDALASRVYATALDVIHRNPAVKILGQDPARQRLELAEGDRRATLSVTELGDKLSQLVVAGTTIPGEAPASSRVAEAVLRVCREMRKQCSVGG
jgi:hypothetical protein